MSPNGRLMGTLECSQVRFSFPLRWWVSSNLAWIECPLGALESDHLIFLHHIAR